MVVLCQGPGGFCEFCSLWSFKIRKVNIWTQLLKQYYGLFPAYILYCTQMAPLGPFFPSEYFVFNLFFFLSVTALYEAQDVDLHLRPLERHIQSLQETELPKLRALIPPLFHTICLIWSHSTFYNTPARILVLLQEFCNLFIDQVAQILNNYEYLINKSQSI